MSQRADMPAWAASMAPVDMDGAAVLLGVSRDELTKIVRVHAHFERRGTRKVFYPEHIEALEGALAGGHIYYLRCQDRVKIGFSRGVRHRIRALVTMCPYPTELLAIVPGTMIGERRLHEQWSSYRLHGEWFRYDYDLKDFIAGLGK